MSPLKKILLFTFFCFVIQSYSQENNTNFRPVFSLGFGGSQIDGDTYAGYDKANFIAGIGVNKCLVNKIEIEFSINYTQKGARKNYGNGRDSLSFYVLHLNYVELPIMIKYNYKKVKFEGGISYGYLFHYSEQNNAASYYNTNNLHSYDWCYNLGLGYKINDHLLVNFRYSYSLIPIRDYNLQRSYTPNIWSKVFNKGLYNNLFFISINCIINPQ